MTINKSCITTVTTTMTCILFWHQINEKKREETRMTQRRKEKRRKKKEGESSEWLENKNQAKIIRIYYWMVVHVITSHHLPECRRRNIT